MLDRLSRRGPASPGEAGEGWRIAVSRLLPASLLLRLLGLLLLCGATLALNESAWRYQPGAPLALANLGFEEGFAHWSKGPAARLQSEGAAPQLQLQGGGGQAYVWRPLQPDPSLRFLSFTGEASGEGLRPFSRLPAGSLVLRSYGPDGQVLSYWPRRILALDGSSQWTPFRRVLPIHPAARQFWLIAEADAAEGSFGLRNLAIAAASERPAYLFLRGLLAGLWIPLTAWLLWPLAKGARSHVKALALALGIFLSLLALVPEPHFSDGRSAVLRLLAPDEASASSAASTNPQHEAGGPLDPGHVLAFLLLTALALKGYGRGGAAASLLSLLAFAVAIEAVQSFTLTREAEFSDLLSDLIGIAAAGSLSLCWLLAGARFARKASDR